MLETALRATELDNSIEFSNLVMGAPRAAAGIRLRP
jgi:hypothetical protein